MMHPDVLYQAVQFLAAVIGNLCTAVFGWQEQLLAARAYHTYLSHCLFSAPDKSCKTTADCTSSATCMNGQCQCQQGYTNVKGEECQGKI